MYEVVLFRECCDTVSATLSLQDSQFHLSQIETNTILTKLIITFGLSIPSTTGKSKQISDSLYSLY